MCGSPYGTRVPPFLMASQVSVEAAADAWTRLGSFHERVCEKTDRKRAKVAGNCRNSTVTRWRSKLGVELESALTGTDPPFVFAYNPADRDMDRMKAAGFILEPVLTHVWHETSSACCAAPGGLVIDVGGNYGWFTLYSVALGCSVAVFEPVPAYQEIIRLGLRLNPGFAERVTLYGNVVTTGPPGKTYSLMVPVARPAAAGAARRGGKKETLGMTAMVGAAGPGKDPRHMKGASVREHRAKAARIDDVIGGAAGHPRDVCVLKADVEGYEAQVLQTAERLLAAHRVATLIFEVTKWSVRDGTRATGTARVSLGQELSRPQPRCTHSSRHVAASVPDSPPRSARVLPASRHSLLRRPCNLRRALCRRVRRPARCCARCASCGRSGMSSTRTRSPT